MRKLPFERFDFSSHRKERRKMANYLRLHSCRVLSARQLLARKIRRRRTLFVMAAMAIAAMGIYSAFF